MRSMRRVSTPPSSTIADPIPPITSRRTRGSWLAVITAVTPPIE